jgi:hypothetical protein
MLFAGLSSSKRIEFCTSCLAGGLLETCFFLISSCLSVLSVSLSMNIYEHHVLPISDNLGLVTELLTQHEGFNLAVFSNRRDFGEQLKC